MKNTLAFAAGLLAMSTSLFAHHSPVHSQLPSHPFDRPDAVLVLAPDLLV